MVVFVFAFRGFDPCVDVMMSGVGERLGFIMVSFFVLLSVDFFRERFFSPSGEFRCAMFSGIFVDKARPRIGKATGIL